MIFFRIDWFGLLVVQGTPKSLLQHHSSKASNLQHSAFFVVQLSIDTFELWCWRRLLSVSWTARRSNQLILKATNPEYSLEGLILKLQYCGHLMRRADSLEKTLILGKIESEGEGDDRGWDGWMATPTQWTWVWSNSRRWWMTEKPGMLQSVGVQSQTQLSN